MQTKNKKEILNKLGITALNPMQEAANQAIRANDEVVLLSPTGTGKTLAFLLPLIEQLNPALTAIQLLIIVPSRELAIQIEQVTREMGSGYKVNVVYGGRAGSKEKIELKHPPAILVGTPGRVADHIRRENIETNHIKTLVLDEFDKSLEVGFANEMIEIVEGLPFIEKKILTSATQNVEIPHFVGIKNATVLNYLGERIQELQVQQVVSPEKDKLETLLLLLQHLGKKNGIVFCNFKDTIEYVSDYLYEEGVDHVCFFGGLEQVDRERALIKFRNGTHRLMIATDLAARGIDVPELDFIIHYQLPHTAAEFTHRNGRTARMNNKGTAYVLKWAKETLPEFITDVEELIPVSKEEDLSKEWETIYISGGRKDKISKGDIAGLFFKQGNLEKNELGVIELKQDCAFVAVPRSKARSLVQNLNNSRLKKRKVRISLLE